MGEIERQLRMPQPTVSKHLRVLREAGIVESTVDAPQRIGQRIPLRFAEQEVDMLRHDYIAIDVESVTTPHPFQG